ncbi:MAG: DNA/RNA nuclease SfsA [Candidatus Thermoplasmatota archaeon]|nr:DNA/RNA nuclease SfsA [Candidatus Thermoplasmatota archaeon]
MRRGSVKLNWDCQATFVSRPNRFLARAVIDGMEDKGPQDVHVHDPGRLKEVLVPGTRLLVKKAVGEQRKTGWDLIAGRVDGQWVLVNSSLHRHISQALLQDPGLSPFGKAMELKPEVRVGRSRLDYRMIDDRGRELYIEVKGCSLTIDKVALFPDAPTERGSRHLEELMDIVEHGHRAGILILVVGPHPECFSPNFRMDPLFSATFMEALGAGVEAHPICYRIEGDEIRYIGPIPLCMDPPDQR